MPQPDDESGITLVEILFSLVILGIVLTAFVQVIAGGLRSLSDSGNRQQSSQMSTEVIETLRALSPAEAALYVDPLVTDATEVDPTAVSDCTAQIDDDGDGTVDRTPLGFDPDGPGPLDCEELRTSSQGAITSTMPYAGTAQGVTVTTIATISKEALTEGMGRVTVVLDYSSPGAQQIRRQALFSEVSRG